jgi:hypothetical protein
VLKLGKYQEIYKNAVPTLIAALLVGIWLNTRSQVVRVQGTKRGCGLLNY